MERETGIEPATNSLEGCDSTTELLPPSRHHLRPAATARQAPSSRLARFPARRFVGRTRCAALVVNRLPPGPAARALPRANRPRAGGGSLAPRTKQSTFKRAHQHRGASRRRSPANRRRARRVGKKTQEGAPPTNFLHPAPTLLRAGGRKLVGRGGFEPP